MRCIISAIVLFMVSELHAELFYKILTDKPSIGKKDKNTWVVDPKGETAVCISYPVYCFEQSVRTSYIDNDHAFLLLTSCLMYPDGFKGYGELQLEFPTSWTKVSTTLERIDQNH